MSEDLRLLYVALTRAQYQCTVVVTSGEIRGFDYASALNWIVGAVCQRMNGSSAYRHNYSSWSTGVREQSVGSHYRIAMT